MDIMLCPICKENISIDMSFGSEDDEEYDYYYFCLGCDHIIGWGCDD